MGTIKDFSVSNANGTFDDVSIGWSDKGLVFSEKDSSLKSGLFSIGSEITIEEWFTPKGASRVTRLVGELLILTLEDNKEWRFSFLGGGVYRGRLEIEPGKKYYVAVSHIFGNSSSTFIAVNGRKIPGSWITGTGNEAPTVTTNFITISLGQGDTLHQLKISDTAKTLAYVKQYFGGAA